MQKRSYLISAIVIGVIFLFILFGGNKARKDETANPTPGEGNVTASSSDSTNNAAESVSQTPPVSE